MCYFFDVRQIVAVLDDVCALFGSFWIKEIFVWRLLILAIN